MDPQGNNHVFSQGPLFITPTITHRNNLDSEITQSGREVVHLCQALGLYIVNWRFRGDFLGRFTDSSALQSLTWTPPLSVHSLLDSNPPCVQNIVQNPKARAMVPFHSRYRYRWQYKAIHWLKQTEHRKRTKWQPKTIYWSLQTEKGFNRQALSSKKAAAHQFRPHRAVCPGQIWWKLSGSVERFHRSWMKF